jgi:hypothetical protein
VKKSLLSSKTLIKILMVGSIDVPIYPLNLLRSSNYFHLLIEHLPRFIKLKSDGVVPRDAIIVLGPQHNNLLDAFFAANNSENRFTTLPYANGLTSHTFIGTSGSFHRQLLTTPFSNIGIRVTRVYINGTCSIITQR